VPKKSARGHTQRPASRVSSDPLGAVAAAFLALVLAGSALFVDSGAQASFDAPKRLTALVGLALAAAAALAWPGPREPRAEPSRAARIAAWLLAAALAWAFLSCLFSPRRPAAFDALRTSLLSCLALCLGGSRVVGRSRLLPAVFLGSLALDAGVSIAQRLGWYKPFELQTVGVRDATGAFAGNVGYLSIALSLGLMLSLGAALYAGSRALRLAGAALSLLFVCDLAVNRNLTAILAAAAGGLVLILCRFGRRSAVPMVAAGGLLVLVAGLYPPMRERVAHVMRAASAGDWDRLVTYRGGAWVAALEMARDRPLLGFGPGTFGAEFVPHRLAAEIRYGRRFVNPLVTSSYAETHCDYLQPFAEVGVPGGLAAVSAAALLLAAALGRLARASGPERVESAVLLAMLVAGAVAALLWFPLQRPITAVPLLLVAGRIWRTSGGGEDPSASKADNDARPLPGGGRRLMRLAPSLALVAALSAAVWPEIPRYLAERKLRLIESALRLVLTRPSEITDPGKALDRMAGMSLEAAAALPGDPRPVLLAAGAALARGEGERAVAFYLRALSFGERAEIDLDLGRASEAVGRRDEAEAWFVRGGWVSPPLLATLLPDVAASARAEIRRLAVELVAGRLKAPPPLPQESR
jgi:O-antigen ligase